MSIKVITKFENLDEVLRALRAVGGATDSVFMEAARAGGEVVQRHANTNAPGPHIDLEVVTESGRATASIGPKKDKWFYKFHEWGTKAHKAKVNKSARAFRNYLRQSGSAELASTVRIRPMMTWVDGGTRIWAEKVRGIPAKPFMQPAIERTGEISEAVGQVYMTAIKRRTGT